MGALGGIIHMLTHPSLVGESLTMRIWRESYPDAECFEQPARPASPAWQDVQAHSAGAAGR